MVSLQAFLTLLSLVTLSSSQDIPQPTRVYNFPQILDHFSYSNESTMLWNQRVFEYDAFWKNDSGPLFVYTGNEGPLESFWNNTGFMFDLAPKMGALIVFIEHRYYGESLPFGDDSFSTNNLRYLASTQAVSDFANVIVQIKKEKRISKVVSFGGSYGGMLTAWLRIKYPQVVDVAVAASAPLPMMAQSHKMPKAFFQIVTEDFALANEKCPDIVRTAFKKLDVLRSIEGGDQVIGSTFSLCTPFNSTQFDHLVGWIRNSLLMMAMVDYPYPADFFGRLPAWPVKAACEIMLGEALTSKDELQALANAAGLFYNGTEGTKECFDIYEDFIYCADITGCGTGPEAVAWDFQCCTEFQLAQPSNNVTDMFPAMAWNESIVGDYCMNKYNVRPDPVRASREYWSADFTAASNIIFSNGLLDPWHAGGVLEDVNPSVKAIVIAEGAHHLDLRGANANDPESVKAARLQEIELIQSWLAGEEKQPENLIHF